MRTVARKLVLVGLATLAGMDDADAGSIRGSLLFPEALPAGQAGQSPPSSPDTVVWLEGGQRASSAGRAVLSQRNLRFSTPLLVVTVGETVEMPNEDDVAHNVFSLSSARRFNLGIYPRGTSKEIVFERPGVVEVLCSLHRRMKSTIVVVPSEHHAIVQAGSQYRILDVPGGGYVARAWKNGYASRAAVTVPEMGEVVLDLALAKSVQ